MHSLPAVLPGSACPASLLHLPTALAAINPEPPAMFVLIGFLVLTGLLIYLWLTVHQMREAMRVLERRLESPAFAKPPLPSPTSPAPVPVSVEATPAVRVPPASDEIDEGVLTAIAAAVATVFKQPYRIIAIQSDASAQIAWSSEGRRELYHSHRIR